MRCVKMEGLTNLIPTGTSLHCGRGQHYWWCHSEHHVIEDKFGGTMLRASLVSSMLNVNQKMFTSRIRGLSQKLPSIK
jgi:hypothetical protein